MNKIVFIFLLLIIALSNFSQGLINNGASIVFSGSSQVYIDGASGHYTNQLGGLITPSATSSITLLGNWVNNSSPVNVAFNNDGGGVILAGANQTIGGSNPTAFYNLSLTGSGTKQLTVNSNTVGGQSAYSGILSLGSRPLDLNGNRIDITNSAVGAITRSSGYIISERNAGVNPSIVRWFHRTTAGSKVYPFGVSVGYYIPFTLNITTALPASTDYVDVSTRATPSDNLPWAGVSNVAAVAHMYSPNVPYADGTIPAVIDRWWDITPSGAVTADATFSYLGSENTLDPLYSPGLIGAQYWNGTGWMPNNAVIGSAAVVSGVGVVGSVTAPGLTNFCPWVLSALLSPLPIELINFDATCYENKVLLNWCTATENNNLFFTVEHSTNGIDFYPLGNVTGSGTTSTKHCYSFEATALSDGINYYKLTETDNLGKVTSSKIISINGCESTKDNIVITNSGSTIVGILINSTSNQKLNCVVHNSLGQIVAQREIVVIEGFNSIEIDLSELSNSIYYISMLNNEENLSSKKIILSSNK